MCENSELLDAALYVIESHELYGNVPLQDVNRLRKAARRELDQRLTPRAVDEGESAPLQAESTPEHLPIEEADTTPALRN